VDALNHEFGMLWRYCRQNAVPKVEDVPRTSGVFIKYPLYFAFNNCFRRVQYGGVQIALYRHLGPKAITGGTKVDMPVLTP